MYVPDGTDRTSLVVFRPTILVFSPLWTSNPVSEVEVVPPGQANPGAVERRDGKAGGCRRRARVDWP
jgi:hypothetical protein